jgi:hypothetical protein
MRWALVFPAVLAVASCDEPDVHILSGQLYLPQNACIEPVAGVDVIEGPATGDNCGPLCLTINEGDATSIYVTTQCPPYPGDYTVEGVDATTGDADLCVGAFAAYNDDAAVCPPDLGEGGVDAGTDAPSDAATDAPGDAGPGDAAENADGGD